jgi:hypothetical protein
MAGLFDVVNRRRRSRELADRFREGASPEELEYFERFYQEPTSSPVWSGDTLESELDAADALQRALMARGMNNLQAKDAVRRAKEQEESALGTRAEYIAATRGPDQIGGTGPGSYEDYRQSANTAPSPEGRYAAYKRQIPQVGTEGAAELLAEQGLPSPPQEQPASFEDWSAQQPPPSGPQPLSLEDWSRQTAMQQQMAGDVSAAADARYKSETVDDRIGMIESEFDALPAKLAAQGATNEMTTMLMTELAKQLDIARTSDRTTEQGAAAYDNAISAAQDLHSIGSGRSGGTGYSSYSGPGEFIGDVNTEIKESVEKSQASQGGAAGARQDGQNFLIPTTEKVVGDYPQ